MEFKLTAGTIHSLLILVCFRAFLQNLNKLTHEMLLPPINF